MDLNLQSKRNLFWQNIKIITFVVCIITQSFYPSIATAYENENKSMLESYIKSLNQPNHTLIYTSNEAFENNQINNHVAELELNTAVLNQKLKNAEYNLDNYAQYSYANSDSYINNSNYYKNDDYHYNQSNDNNISEISKQFQIIRGQIEELQHIIDKIDQNLQVFDNRISSLEAQSHQTSYHEQNNSKNNDAKIAQVDQKNLINQKTNNQPTADNDKTLENEKKNTKLDYTNKEQKSKQEEVERDNINRILSSIDEQLISSIQSEKVATTTNNDKIEDSREYQEAFTLLKTTYQGNKNFDQVRSAFTKFIDTHPKSMMLGNAYYWLAETYMYDKNYNNAAIQYLKGYQAPHNERTIDNLIGLSKSLFQLGKYQQVCSTIVQIAKEKDKPTLSMQKEIEKLATKAGCKA